MYIKDQENIPCSEHPPVPQLKHKQLLQLMEMEWKCGMAKNPESPALKPIEHGFYPLKLSDLRKYSLQ